MFEKSETPPSPAWVDAECAKFEGVLQEFTAAMRAQFRKKAMEGRDRWDKPESAAELYNVGIAHMAAVPLAAGEEAHVANFLAFLFCLRMRRMGVALPYAPSPAGSPA